MQALSKTFAYHVTKLLKHYDFMVSKKTARQTLSDNLKQLMAQNPGLQTETAVGRAAQLAQKTVNNLLHNRHNPRLDEVEKAASAFGLQVWQFLSPDLNPTLYRWWWIYNQTTPRGRIAIEIAVEGALEDMRRQGPSKNEKAGTPP